MKAKWSDPAYRETVLAVRAAKGFAHTPESKAKIAAANRKRKGVFKHSDESRRKISEANVWKVRKGDFRYRGFVETKRAGKIGFRSLWEKQAAMMLDEMPGVVSFQYEALAIPYEWEGRRRLTIPDFLVLMTDGSTQIVEVKPRGYRDSPKESAKGSACRSFCLSRSWSYAIWDERTLWPGLSQSEVRAAVKRMT